MGIFNKLTGRIFNQEEYRLDHPGLKDPLAGTGATAGQALLRASIAIDAVTTAVILADENHLIVRANKAARDLLKAAERDIRNDLAGFSADALVGASFDIFVRDAAFQHHRLDALEATHVTEITVGGHQLRLVATPMFDGPLRAGTVVELSDLTDSNRAEREKAALAESQKQATRDYEEIRAALDSTSSGVMLADSTNTIVYVNEALTALMEDVEADVRSTVPGFSARELVGKPMDMFHRHPDHQVQMIEALRSKHYARIKLGNKTLRMLMNPVFDAQGNRRGTIVELRDLTLEMELENTALRAIDAAANGDFGNRINADGQTGNMQHVFRAINRLFDVLQQVMGETNEAMSAVASGDLTRKILTEYPGVYGQLRDDINNSIDRLVGVVTEIREGAANVKDGAGEIFSGNANLSSRTEQQAASLEETSSAMEEITTTVQQNAHNAVQANTLARGAREAAENGGQVVGRAVAAMEAISTSSKKINDIIGVIDEIAFQTNLLALNAAVEAARAGDQGRGFAVVADEVRNLAGRSATAAKEIKELIKDSGEKVREGSLLVNQSGSTLDDIVTAVKKVNDIVAEISTASDEQATGLNEIARAVNEMDEMTQQNAALVEQAAAASEALGGQADNLDRLIAFFKTGEEVVRKAPAPAAPVARTAPPRARTATAAAPAARKSALATKPKARVAAKPAPKAKPAAAQDDDKTWTEF